MISYGVTNRQSLMSEESESSVDDESKSQTATIVGTERKKRRGVIEKRRRDRINCSLYDLKRLIPELTNKTGANKLEKAEILQATVDFLRRIYREGHVFTSEARAIELRRLGFRECLLEVTRLLSTYQNNNGSNIDLNELRRSLLTSLHQYDSQRELDSKAYLTNVAAVANAIVEQQNQTSTAASQEKFGRSHQPIDSDKRGCAQAASPCVSTRHTCNNEVVIQEARVIPPRTIENTTRPSFEGQTYVPNDKSFVRNSFLTNTDKTADNGLGFMNSSLGNHTLAVPYRPNESQSTSSPPLRSTPEDTDPGSSPQPSGSCLPTPISTEDNVDFVKKHSPSDKVEPLFATLTTTPSNLCGKAATYLTHQRQYLETFKSREPGLRKVAVFPDGHHHTQTNPAYSVPTYNTSFHDHHAQPYVDHYVRSDHHLGNSIFHNSSCITCEYTNPSIHCEATYSLPQVENYLTNVPYWQY